MLAVANSAACRDGAPRQANLESCLRYWARKPPEASLPRPRSTNRLRPTRHPASALDQFWLHSLTCAHLARRLAVTIDYSEPEEAYLCGLLHDLGKLVIGVRHGRAFTIMQEIRHSLARRTRYRSWSSSCSHRPLRVGRGAGGNLAATLVFRGRHSLPSYGCGRFARRPSTVAPAPCSQHLEPDGRSLRKKHLLARTVCWV